MHTRVCRIFIKETVDNENAWKFVEGGVVWLFDWFPSLMEKHHSTADPPEGLNGARCVRARVSQLTYWRDVRLPHGYGGHEHDPGNAHQTARQRVDAVRPVQPTDLDPEYNHTNYNEHT